jgi:hypothetical protein
MSGLDPSARGISPAAATVTPDKQDYESDAEASPVVFMPGSGKVWFGSVPAAALVLFTRRARESERLP